MKFLNDFLCYLHDIQNGVWGIHDVLVQTADVLLAINKKINSQESNVPVVLPEVTCPEMICMFIDNQAVIVLQAPGTNPVSYSRALLAENSVDEDYIAMLDLIYDVANRYVLFGPGEKILLHLPQSFRLIPYSYPSERKLSRKLHSIHSDERFGNTTIYFSERTPLYEPYYQYILQQDKV